MAVLLAERLKWARDGADKGGGGAGVQHEPADAKCDVGEAGRRQGARHMLAPQHMRCDIEAASWLTSWRQRACDRGWPVVGWQKEKRITLGVGKGGGGGFRVHRVKQNTFIGK